MSRGLSAESLIPVFLKYGTVMLFTIPEYDENVTGETERFITSNQLSMKSANSTSPVRAVTGTAAAGTSGFGSSASGLNSIRACCKSSSALRLLPFTDREVAIHLDFRFPFESL